MKRHPRTLRSIFWFTVFVAVVAGISLPVTQRQWSAGGGNSHRDSAEGTLRSLVLEGPELHASLRARPIDSIRHPPGGVLLPSNPHLSTDTKFVEAISRSGSQGKLDGEGIRSAFYALYAASKNELGIYGLEAKSDAEADKRENAIREIWAYNARRDLARVHRKNRILVVLWHTGVSPECWKTADASVVDRLNAPGML